MDIQNIVTEQDTETLDAEITAMTEAFTEEHYLNNDEAEHLEMIVAKSMVLGELYERAKWQAKSQAVPEGFVLVPEDKISHFYQDNDEPENFCNSSNDWDCLGDGIEKDQIMIVNKHTQANISTEKFYGAWKLIETSYGYRWKFELFESESEAKQAMVEAQEQSHD